MKMFLLFLLALTFSQNSWAQKTEEFDVTFEQDIKVNGNLEVNSTSLASKPCPVMTEAQRNAIASPQSGRCVYNSNTNQLNIYNGIIWKSAGGGISNWETAFNYALNDVVIESNKIYQCNTAHTSTVFASDIANWTLISDNLPIDLTTDVTDVLPMANGGTDKALTPVLGGLVYTDDLSMEVLAAGASGQVLKSNGAAAPSWEDASNKVQGQAQTEVDFTKLEFPNQNVTQTATDVQLVYDSGLIFDGGFESATAFQGHTIVSGATYFSVVTAASDVLDGKKTARVTCFNAAPSGVCKIEQTVNLGTPRLRGFPMLLSVRVDSSPDQPLTFCAKIDGVEKDCVTGYKGYLTIPTLAGVTSVGYTLSKNEYVSPLTSFFDSIKVEITETVTNAPAIGPWNTFSPSGTWTTNTAYVGKFRQVGSSAEISITANVSGTPNTANLEFNIPNGLTIDSSQVSLATNFYTLGTCSTRSATILYPCYVMYKSATSVSVHVLRPSSAQNHDPSPISPTIPNTFTSGDSVSVLISVPIAQYQASVPTYSDRCRDQINCETQPSFSRDTSNVISGVFPASTSFAPTCTGTTTVTCNITSGNFAAAPKCWARRDSAGTAGFTFEPSSISTTSVVIPVVDASANPINSSIRVYCQRQGQDYINAKVNQIVGSFKDYVRTPNTTTGKVGFCSAKISATGVISDQLGGCFASCTNATTPVCTFTSNYWRSGSVPNCWASCDDWATGKTIENSTTTSTTCDNASFTPQAVGREYFCHGEIQ